MNGAERDVVGAEGSGWGSAAEGWLVLDRRDGADGAERDGWGGAGLCGAERALSSCFWPGGAAEATRNPLDDFVDSKDWATPLLRSRGVGRGGEGRGSQGLGKDRTAWAMWGSWAREAGVARWRGTAAAGQGGAGGWVGGRSDLGLGVEGACRERTRQGAATGQAEPSSSSNSLLVRSSQAAPGGQPPFESLRQNFRYCGDSNLLELKSYPEPKFDAANVSKNSLEFVGHAEQILFPFYKPRHKASTGPKLTNSKSQILRRASDGY